MAKLKGYILNVERCNNKTVLEVYTLVKGKQSSFIKDNKQITRFFGPPVPQKAYEQARAVFGKSEKIIKPKDDKKSAEKKKLRQISARSLTRHEKKRFSTLQKAGINYLMLGWVKIDCWQETNEGLKKIPRRIIDLPAAIRQQDHILEKYKEKIGRKPGEIQLLLEFHQIISKIHSYLINWKESGKKEREKIQYEIARIILQLAFCVNFYKTEARDSLYDMSSLEDALGRLNPPAMAANIVPILGFLADRLEQIRATVPIIALRKELLKFEKNVMDAERKNALIKIKALLRKSNHEILKEKKSTETRINQITHFLYRLHPSPYYEARHLCINILSKIRLMLNTEKIPQARHYLKIVHHILSNEL